MKPKIAKLWVAALRSGKFKQAKDALRKKDVGHCCLGVLCELFRKLKKKGHWSKRHDGTYAYVLGKEEIDYVLPGTVAVWAGCDANPTIEIEHLHVIIGDKPCSELSCGAANDNGLTFDQIADAIERTYLQS